MHRPHSGSLFSRCGRTRNKPAQTKNKAHPKPAGKHSKRMQPSLLCVPFSSGIANNGDVVEILDTFPGGPTMDEKWLHETTTVETDRLAKMHSSFRSLLTGTEHDRERVGAHEIRLDVKKPIGRCAYQAASSAAVFNSHERILMLPGSVACRSTH